MLKQICNAPETFLKAVKKLDEEMWEDGKEYYYSLREHYNDKLMKAEFDVELAALFVFINKHCFNGLYRVNGKGLFNVPYNNSRRASVDENAIMEISKYLQGVKIIDGDFEVACKDAKKGDFVFIDSPYAPLNPTSFESYTKEGFDIESHKRLANLFDELTARGCYCMLTNHNTELINELYGSKGYKIDVVSVKRMINSMHPTELRRSNYMQLLKEKNHIMKWQIGLNNVLNQDILEEVVAFCLICMKTVVMLGRWNW